MNNGLIALLIIILLCLALMVVLIIQAPKLDQKDLDSMLAEDLDQAERDYYDRESERPLAGCVLSFKAIGIITLIYALYHLIRFLA